MAELEYAKRWHSREDSGIRLDRDFVWWHDDERIAHARITELFNQSLVPAGDGRFKLEVGGDWCFVTVEGAAYQVTAVDAGEDAVFLRLSDRTGERLELSTLRLDTDGVLGCEVKSGRARARFTRDAQFGLGSLLEEVAGHVVLHLGAQTVPFPLELR